VKWIAIILIALGLVWLWRNQRRLRAQLGRAVDGRSRFRAGDVDKGGFLPSSAANTPTLVNAGNGPDALPDCASSHSICGG